MTWPAAETVTAGVDKALRRIPSQMRRSLTWDRGTEMATNDLLRQCFPKGTALSGYTPQEHRACATDVGW